MSGNKDWTVEHPGHGAPDRIVPGPLSLQDFIGGSDPIGPGTEDEAYDNVLDPHDPFEAVLCTMVAMNRAKRRDYAVDGSPWSNFDFTAVALGIDPVDCAVHNVAQKLARLSALRPTGGRRTRRTRAWPTPTWTWRSMP
jgi:hypothetical protein